MKLYSRIAFVTLLSVAIFLGVQFSVMAKSQSKIKGEFENEGVETEASGRAKSSFKGSNSKFSLKFKGLEPGEDYSLFVGGILEAEFTSGSSGSVGLKFASRVSGSTLLLNFDPRGERLSLMRGSNSVLTLVYSGTGEPGGISVDERTELARTSLAPAASHAEAAFRMKKGQSSFEVEIEDVPAGSYGLFVDGISRGTIAVSSKGKGNIEFESEPGAPNPLSFDPRGLIVDVTQDTNVWFTGRMLAQVTNVNVCTISASEAPITSSGVDPDGTATARLVTKGNCERSFEVEIEDVPVGDYDLAVGGVSRGTITVSTNSMSTHGEIEFETEADNSGHPLLTFDPVGQLISISQGATVFFSGTFIPGPPVTNTCAETETSVALLNSGTDADAKGDARFREHLDCRQDFRVEIENLPAGGYDLVVGGITRGTVTVTNVGGDFRGEVEFDTEPSPGKLLLDFDPRGQLIEIRQGATTFLSRAFPSS